MNDKLQFREKLNGILELGNARQKVLGTEDVEKYFEEDQLSPEQMELVYDYLLSQRIAVNGYVKHGGTVCDMQENAEETVFSEADRQYLEEYEEELKMLKPACEKEQRMQQYFPRVIEIAKELYTPDFFIGDLIQEGNVGLITAMEGGETQEKRILECARQMIQILMEEQSELKRRDEKMVEKVVQLNESVKRLTEELERKPTIDELAAYMELTEEEINDILRLTGEDDDEEEEEE